MNSGIEVFFTKVNQPWSNEQTSYSNHWVNVYSPDGVEKVGVLAVNGHASIDLPPGRYLVTGTINGVYVNFDSNETLVNVGCGQRPCVTIIPRSLHFCIWWASFALKQIAKNKEYAPEIANLAPKGLDILMEIEKAIPEKHRQLSFLTKSVEVLEKKVKR